MVRWRTIEEELQSNPELRMEDIKELRSWVNEQPHLPNIDDIPDTFLSFFLRRRYYNLEKAKKTLDNFLTFRTNEPEMSQNRNLQRPEIRTYLDTNYVIPLNERDSFGYLVLFVDYHDSDISKFDLAAQFKGGQAVVEAWVLENGSVGGQTVIYDQRHLSLRHIMKTSLSVLRNVAYYNKDCSFASMKRIFLVNSNGFIQKIMKFLKPILPKELLQKLSIFTPSQMDEFYKLVPRESLPHEYGGSAGTLKELHKKSEEMLQRNEDFFEKLDRLKVDESKRPGKNKLLPSFKKMDLD